MKDKLIKVQAEYIALLERECSRLGSTMTVHSYLRPSNDDVELGKKLRAEIKSLQL